jgi:two-component system chemotaxis response regulator CheY
LGNETAFLRHGKPLLHLTVSADTTDAMTAGAMTETRSVLVADDTAFVRDRFKTAIEAAGHQATVVGTAPDALSLLRAAGARFDLIVLDLQLPQANGLELLRAVHATQASHGPIVVFSGTIASVADVRELGALGVAGYINEYTSAQNILPALAPHLFPDHYRRRTSPRVALGIPVAYRFGNTIATATMVNISHGGLGIRTTNVLEAGTTIKARFRLPGTPREVDADAVIAWMHRGIGMGAQFTQLADDDQALIDEFVQAHFFSNRKA